MLSLLATLLFGCAGSRRPGPWDTADGGAVVKDTGLHKSDGSATDQLAGKDKMVQPDKVWPPDTVPSPVALQAVINKLILPKNSSEYAVDLDGNGSKDNQLGNITGSITALGLGNDLQKDLDASMQQGKVLLLFKLFATSLINDASISIRLYKGKDLDNDPKDNFSGHEPLAIDPAGPQNLKLVGKIAGSLLQAGPGDLMAPIPIGGQVVNVSLKLARVKASLSSSGMTQGQLNGAIPMSDMNSLVLPNLAQDLDKTWKKETDPAKKLLLGSFDTDKDGTITGKDLQNNALVKMMFNPDVDTTGNKIADAMSLGMGFTAVGCKIQ